MEDKNSKLRLIRAWLDKWQSLLIGIVFGYLLFQGLWALELYTTVSAIQNSINSYCHPYFLNDTICGVSIRANFTSTQNLSWLGTIKNMRISANVIT